MSSESQATVVRILSLEPHPDGDRLEIAKVPTDYQVVVGKGDFQAGELGVFIPPDLEVPVDSPLFSFLSGRAKGSSRVRIRACKFRGVFSCGLLIPSNPSWVEGQDVTELLGITKYVSPPELSSGGEDEQNPGYMPVYTDIESLRKYGNILQVGEMIFVTEKCHGANARYVFRDSRLWCGSHKNIKRDDPKSIWWNAARYHGLAEKLAPYPDLILYGEVYGQVQDLKYDIPKGEVRLIIFDAMDFSTKRYLPWSQTEDLCRRLDLPTIPILHYGAWNPSLAGLAEGNSVLGNGTCLREGIVIRPEQERWDPQVGRVILKLHGEGYLTRKERKT